LSASTARALMAGNLPYHFRSLRPDKRLDRWHFFIMQKVL